MNIMDVKVRLVSKGGAMKAVASFTIDDEFAVHDVKVIEGEKGLFVAMPSRKTLNGDFLDIVHPINSETRAKIQTAILQEYENLCEQKA
jgi:stage V sporulation protein G